MKKQSQTTGIMYHSPTVSSSYHHIFSETTGIVRQENKHLSFSYRATPNQFRIIKLQPKNV